MVGFGNMGICRQALIMIKTILPSMVMIMMKMMMQDETLFMLVRHGHSLVTECYQRPPSPNTPLCALLSLTGWGVGFNSFFGFFCVMQLNFLTLWPLLGLTGWGVNKVVNKIALTSIQTPVYTLFS